jgi:hypothetical protein
MNGFFTTVSCSSLPSYFQSTVTPLLLTRPPEPPVRLMPCAFSSATFAPNCSGVISC